MLGAQEPRALLLRHLSQRRDDRDPPRVVGLRRPLVMPPHRPLDPELPLHLVREPKRQQLAPAQAGPGNHLEHASHIFGKPRAAELPRRLQQRPELLGHRPAPGRWVINPDGESAVCCGVRDNPRAVPAGGPPE
jgi:hypothetical protein